MKIFKAILFFVLIGNLLYAQNPRLWGMTTLGGPDSVGTIVKINGDGTGFGVAFAFNFATGQNPVGNLLQASNGKLYGMAKWGGIYNKGVIFSFDTITNNYNTVFDFDIANGANPSGSLIQLNNGMMYGMTPGGGNDSIGVLFSFDPSSNNFTKLFDFDTISGYIPNGDLLLASDGKLYGMTSLGGTYEGGTIFSFDPSNHIFLKLLDFNLAFGATGVVPYGNLIEIGNGVLYGMTSHGWSNSPYGVIFKYDLTTNSYINLFNFTFFTGQTPVGDLTLATNGLLYGMTLSGGAYNKGTLFSFDTSNDSLTNLFDFNFLTGFYPEGSLSLVSNGLLYGFTSLGGNSNGGVIFSFDPTTNSFTKLYDLDNSTGTFPFGDLIELMSTTGLNSISSTHPDISIYPNPFNDILNISIGDVENYDVRILDVSSRELYHGEASRTIQITTDWLANGVYFYEILDRNGLCQTGKIVKE